MQALLLKIYYNTLYLGINLSSQCLELDLNIERHRKSYTYLVL